MLWWRSEDMHIVHICSPPELQNMYNIVVCCDVLLLYFPALDMQWITHCCVICIAFVVMFFLFFLHFLTINLFIHFQLFPFYIFWDYRPVGCIWFLPIPAQLIVYRIVDHNCITLLGKKHLCTYIGVIERSPLRIPVRGVLLCQGKHRFFCAGPRKSKGPSVLWD